MVLQRQSRVEPSEIATDRGPLAAVIAARRRELGLTQVQLGDLADVSYRIVHNLEAGRTEVSLGRLSRILETLGLHLTIERGVAPSVQPSESLTQHYRLDNP